MHLGSMKNFPQASQLNGLDCTKDKTSARRQDQESLAPLGTCWRVEILTFTIDDKDERMAELMEESIFES